MHPVTEQKERLPMKRAILAAALSTGVALTAMGTAHAAQGCGPGFHRGVYGACRPNYGPRFGYGPGPGPAVGVFYPGRGYWYGGRYWGQRFRYGGGWRYR